MKEITDELGEGAECAVTDMIRRDDVLSLVEQTNKAFGQVDVLINNAGVMPLSLFASGKTDEWDNMVDVNLKGVLYGTNAVLPQMQLRQDGHIVNIASIAQLVWQLLTHQSLA